MGPITTSTELREAIRQLEEKRIAEKELLKEEFSIARERLKPSNVVRSTFSQIFTGTNFIRTAMIASAGVTAAYMSKKYFQGLTGRLLKKILGKVF